MLESSFRNLVAAKRLPDPLVAQLQRFTTSLMEQGYADCTVRWKLRLLTNCGQRLVRNNLAVTKLDERFVEAFLKRKRRHRGDFKTLQQFLDRLRMHNVVPARSVTCDRSPWADILNRYETHLRTERGLVTDTARMTSCWASWKASDYAGSEHGPSPSSRCHSNGGIIGDSACRRKS